jgi:two-component system response regulator
MSASAADHPVEILLVEDNPADAKLAQEGLQECAVPAELKVVPDCPEALRYLRGEGEYERAPCPDLVMLDVKTPNNDCLDALREMEADCKLRRIPVVVVSSSDSIEDLLRAHGLRPSYYVQELSDFPEFHQRLRSRRHLCLTLVKVPPSN